MFPGPARGCRLLLAALPAGRPVDLTPDRPDRLAPRLAPDGKAVVFARRDGDVARVGAGGTNPKRRAEGTRYVAFRLPPAARHGPTGGPDVSPGGRRAAFVAVAGGVPDVCVVGAGGTGRRQATARTAPRGRVGWGPDGAARSFVSFEGKDPRLVAAPAGGGGPRHPARLDGGVSFAHRAPAVP